MKAIEERTVTCRVTKITKGTRGDRYYASQRFPPRNALTKSLVHKKFTTAVAKLGPLSEQHKLLGFPKNVDYTNTLNGFVQDLTYAAVDYQVRIASPITQTI